MKTSAGILPYRISDNVLEVFLVHPGGPFWKKKDNGIWSVAKGEYEHEEAFAAAVREFIEETGFDFDKTEQDCVPLGEVQQKNGKTVVAWGYKGDYDPTKLVSETFLIEWPPKSGKQQEFPEIDRADWFSISEAQEKLLAAQLPFLERLQKSLTSQGLAFSAKGPQSSLF